MRAFCLLAPLAAAWEHTVEYRFTMIAPRS